eukprot:377637-Pelagomonas_calceolata.AAC.2
MSDSRGWGKGGGRRGSEGEKGEGCKELGGSGLAASQKKSHKIQENEQLIWRERMEENWGEVRLRE